MAATVRVYAFDGATASPVAHIIDTNPTDNPSGAKVSFSLADAYNDTASQITIPATGSRRFSDLRYLALYVTAGGGATSLSNLKVALAAAPTTGLELHYLAQTTYTQNTGTTGTGAGQHPADDTVVNGAAPTGYTALSAFVDPTYSTYDATGGAATNGAKCGKYVQMVAAVLGSYGLGGNKTTALPNIKFQYDEA